MEHSAVLLTCIKIPDCFQTFVLSIFEWSLKIGFTVPTYLLSCYVFQQQYAYLAVQALMTHLDSHVRSDPKIKSAILAVLFESVLIAAGGSIGNTRIDPKIKSAILAV